MIKLKTDWTQYDTMKPGDLNTICTAVNERGALIEALQQENETLRGKLAAKADLSAPGATSWDSENMTFLNGSSLNIFLSPEGSDTQGDGSRANPYATMDKAYERIVHTVGGGIIAVVFLDGTYELDKHYSFHGINQRLEFISASSDASRVTLNITHDDMGFRFHGCPRILFRYLTINLATRRTQPNIATITGDCSGIIVRDAALTSSTVQTAENTNALYITQGGSAYVSHCEISNHYIALCASQGASLCCFNNTGAGNTYGVYASNSIVTLGGTQPGAATLRFSNYGGRIFDNQA